MIKKKRKICTACKKEEYIYGKSMCYRCWRFSTPLKLKPQSQKGANREDKYRRLRIAYLAEHPLCEANVNHNCTRVAEQIHHKAGRIGTNLYTNFLAVCDSCHRYIEMNPTEAKERGFSLNRLENESQ